MNEGGISRRGMLELFAAASTGLAAGAMPALAMPLFGQGAGAMPRGVNLFCEESSHLAFDGQPVMVLGALAGDAKDLLAAAARLEAVKARHGLRPDFEFRWGKISPARAAMYREFVEAGLADSALRFHALLLRKQAGHDGYDAGFYAGYYSLLAAAAPGATVHLTAREPGRAQRLRRMGRAKPESTAVTLHRRPPVLSQLTDMLVGAIAAANRGGLRNAGKLAVIEAVAARVPGGLLLPADARHREIRVG